MLLATLGISVVLGVPERADAADGAQPRGMTAGTAWRPCGPRLDCARVRVPLDWSRQGAFTGSTARAAFAGPTISLGVIRHRASRPQRRIGSLFVNFGGPGLPGVATIEERGAEFDRLAQGRYDIVSWDPRGTNTSAPVNCFASDASRLRFWGPNWSVPTTPAESRRYVPKTIEFARLCAAHAGRLLRHASTTDTVRDLDYLRWLVGDRRLNYYGQSYGTFVGQVYANMFPGRVRLMALDAVIDPIPYTRSVQAAIAANEVDTNLLFSKFQSLCQKAGPSRCALAGNGPVAARVNALLARLRRGPIPAPSAPPPHTLSYGDSLFEIYSPLSSPALWPELAEALDQAADGDGSALAVKFSGARDSILGALDVGTSLQCADKPLARPGSVNSWPTVIPKLSRTNFLAPIHSWWLWAPCASWRVATVNRYTGPWNATTENPILLLTNRYDALIAIQNARTVSRRLGNAVLVTNNGYGHITDSDRSACISRVVTRYLTTLRTPRRGTVCQPDHIPFEPGFGE